MRIRDIGWFSFWLFLPLVVGGLSGWVTSGSVETWYLTIEKPSFNPPGWVFGPVWTVLYLMMGVAAGLVFREANSPAGTGIDKQKIPPVNRPLAFYQFLRDTPVDDVHMAKAAFWVQLILNGLWSVIFFGLQQPKAALAEISLLWLAIGWTVRSFARISKVAAWLLVPYWAWVSFATVLNASIWWLNR